MVTALNIRGPGRVDHVTPELLIPWWLISTVHSRHIEVMPAA